MLLLAAGLVLTGCADVFDGGDNGSSIFSNLRVEEITTTGAVVRFTTTLPTTCEVDYGPDGSLLDQTAVAPPMSMMGPFGTMHEVPLSSLTPNTLYYYQARAEDEGGGTYLSDLLSFTTL